LLSEYGTDLAPKAYLFADPFSMPKSLGNGDYLVFDPSFEDRRAQELIEEFGWFHERVRQIHQALDHNLVGLVPACCYRSLLEGSTADTG